jgi:hypothetical protein
MTRFKQTAIRQLERRIAKRKQALERHEPGTSHHTRAQRDIDALKAKIEQIEQRQDGAL